MKTTRRVLVIGAGAAGSAAAAALSEAAPELEVLVVGAEDRAPYNRTTVNKGLLSGAVGDDDIALPGTDLPGVTWLLGRRAVGLDAGARTVRLTTGERLSGDAVLLAVGAAPRRLPLKIGGAAAERVVTLRSAADAARLRRLLTDRAPVVIMGAGLLGCETAGVLTEAGHPIQLVDSSSIPMEGVVGRTVAEWILGSHRQAGVDLKLGASLQSVSLSEHGELDVTFSDGTGGSPRAIVAALGAAPDTDWLASSGVVAASAGAVLVDENQQVVGWPGIYAAGDIAAVPGPAGRTVRIEHWGAALAQGRRAARSILADLGLGDPVGAPPEVPSYSTYVHGTKLTIIGWPHLATTEVPIAGAPGDDRFAMALAEENGVLVGVVGVGGARAANRLRPLIERRASMSELAPADRTA